MHSEGNNVNDILVQFIEESKRRIEEGVQRRANVSAASACRPNEQFFASLDSSVKRSTTFVRKIKHFTSSQLSSLIADISTINLTKYVSEIAAALTEAKLKISDVDAAIELCTALHSKYADFSTHLVSNWKRAFSDAEKTLNGGRLRVELRMMTEAMCSGVVEVRDALPTLCAAVLRMEPNDEAHASALLALAKHRGDALAGLLPAAVARAASAASRSLPRCPLLTEAQQAHVRDLFKKFYSAMCGHLRRTHEAVTAHARQNKKILSMREELCAERRVACDLLAERLLRLKVAVEIFAEVLGEEAPELDEACDADDDDDDGDDEGLRVLGLGVDGAAAWDDDDAMQFYRQLPDVEAFAAKSAPAAESADEEDEPTESKQVDAGNKSQLADFLAGLNNCVNAQMIDAAALDFLARFNRKSARQRLSKVLFLVPRNRMHLLPLFARLAAIVKPAAPEVASELAFQLKQEFRHHIRKKDQLQLESKVRTVRYIGELVKFDAYPRVEALSCLRALFEDFTHHNVDLCCHLLETCGRYLVLHSRTRERMLAYVAQVTRRKAATALDARHVAMLDNALCAVHPPQARRRHETDLPPLHDFLQRLVVDPKIGIDKASQLFAQLDWADEATVGFASRCLSDAHRTTHAGAGFLAQLTARLALRWPEVAVVVVDATLEEIQLGLEFDLPAMRQRRVAAVRYLGQLYLYRVVDSLAVFHTLYLLLSHRLAFEAPDSLMRVRLVCTLLDICGPYFDKGNAAKKLDCFIIFFQNYFLTKKAFPVWKSRPFPATCDSYFKEVITRLRPAALVADRCASELAVQQLCIRLHQEMPDVYQPTDTEETRGRPEEEAVVHGDQEILTPGRDDTSETPNAQCGATPSAESVAAPRRDKGDQDDKDFQRRLDELLDQSAHAVEPARCASVALPLDVRGRTSCAPAHDDSLMSLTLMLRKGSKPMYKRVLLPRDAQMLRKQRQTEQAERAEKERIKRLTLDISRRLQEEELRHGEAPARLGSRPFLI